MSLSKQDMPEGRSLSALAVLIVLMGITVFSQGSGLSFGGALQSFQGSFSIVLVGAPVITAITVLKNGLKAHKVHLFSRAAISWRVWRTGFGSLSPKRFRGLKWVVLSVAGTSFLINLGGPVAVRELGSGQAAAITTLGSLMAGGFALKFAPQWIVRGVVLIAVILAAKLSGEGGVSTLGYVGAACAGSHTWNLPRVLVRLKPLQDEGIVVANLISAPFVLAVAWGWDKEQGVTWRWGTPEIVGALLAGILVMVIPVFLQNQAVKLGMREQDQGAMAAMATPLHALAGGVLSPLTAKITGQAAVLPTVDHVFLYAIVFGAALCAPLMPTDSWKPKEADNVRSAAATP